MEVKVYEGENLQNLINKAKQELGDNVRILYYEEFFEKSWWLPLRKKKKFKLFVEKQEENQTPQIDFSEIMSKVESLIEEKIQQSYVPLPVEEENTGITEELKEFTGEAIDLIKFLTKKGVEIDIAKEIVKSACGIDIESGKMDLSTSTYEEALIKGIEENIKFSLNFDIKDTTNSFKVISFVGPTGVGKTTNLFKIASDFILNKNLKVGVISTDTFKVGATQQARFYANILNIPFYTTADSKNLRKTILELSDMDVVFIDTVGRSHYDAWKLGEIKEILKGGFDWLDCVLTLSCNYDYKEA
ncbi:MAG: flagellar biosynthesis protein FlhF, partial [Aquificota bacterium]